MNRLLKRIVCGIVVMVWAVSARAAEDLTVAVAANVQFAFEELQTVFEQQTGYTLTTVLGSSGKLTAQIENGAPYDVFLSANTQYPLRLIEEGLASEPMTVYARGTLVIWSLTRRDFEMDGLLDNAVQKIALPDPGVAPYGKAAVEALKKLNYYDRIAEKFVYGQNIGQVNQFVLSQSVDLGITARSVVMAPKIKDQGYWIEMNRDLYDPIAQGCVVLKNGRDHRSREAQELFEFMVSPQAQEILNRYGYMTDE